jgi:hypothetical protein
MNFPGARFQNCGGALRVAASFWLGLGLFWLVARQSPAQSPSRPVFPVLTNIPQVLALSEDALRSGQHEVRIHGVITYIPPGRSRLYIQDGTNAIYADFANALSNCAPGDVVEVAGPVKRGYLVPRIVPTEFRVLGQAPLPEPKRGDVTRLAAGEDAMKFVVVRGTVRDMMMVAGPYLMLLVSDHGATYRVHTPMPDGALVPREWLDAEIEARGMARPISDNYGNAFGFVLYQNSTNFISILRPGSSNLFDRPLRTIREAMQAPGDAGRRTKIAGVVLAHVPAKTLFLQDTTGVIRAQLLAPLPKSTDEVQYLEHEPQTQLQPGERVEVIGSRFDGSSLTPGMSDAEFRRVGRATPAPPQAVSIADLEGGKFPDRLVTLKARLLDQRASSVSNTGHLWLVLEADGHVFQALWESESPAQWNLQPDSYYQVTGVSDVQTGD